MSRRAPSPSRARSRWSKRAGRRASRKPGNPNTRSNDAMCGIVGYVGDKGAVDIIVEGLKKLEYRGYDSAGVAVLTAPNVLEVRRAAGRIKNLEAILRERPITCLL